MVIEKSERRSNERAVSDGKPFRASDWVERLYASLATSGNARRWHYDHEVRPSIIRGQKYLVVGKALSRRDPQLHADILKFAEENRLRILEERRTLDLPTSIERRAH